MSWVDTIENFEIEEKAFAKLIEFERANGILSTVRLENKSPLNKESAQVFDGVLQLIKDAKCGVVAELHERDGVQVVFFSEMRLWVSLMNKWFKLYSEWGGSQLDQESNETEE